MPGPPVSVAADPYLFRHLAVHLDGYIIKQLIHDLNERTAAPPQPPLHVNLSVRAILSPGFLRLSEAAQAISAPFGVEVAMIDACADPLAFAAARMALRAQRYGIAIEGLGHESLPFFAPESLEPEFVKLDWSPQIPALQSASQHRLMAAASRIGLERIILQRVETAAAFAWGLANGIRRFQGWHIDALQAAGRMAACQYAAHCTARQCMDRAAATGAAGRSGCQNLALLDAPDIKLVRSARR